MVTSSVTMVTGSFSPFRTAEAGVAVAHKQRLPRLQQHKLRGPGLSAGRGLPG